MSQVPPDTPSDTGQAPRIHAWLFEAKGIQRYLFASGRLRDVVGGSDLVARIAGSDGDDLIALAIAARGLSVVGQVAASGPATSISFSRRAGGAFCLHCASRESLVGLRGEFLRRFLIALPGLEYEDGLGAGADEIASRNAAYASRSGRRGNDATSVLPLGRPVFAINPRSGLPQSGVRLYRSAQGQRADAMDRILAPQRDRADALQQQFAAGLRGDGSNQRRFIVDGAAQRFHDRTTFPGIYAYPRNLADDEENRENNPLFPWRESSSDRRVALVHADLSGLGQTFQNAAVQSAAEALQLGAAIEAAIAAAIGRAADAVILPHAATAHSVWEKVVPARPIVVGGDDIGVLVRADLALPFAARLLEEIEVATKDIGGGLSACAGVAIARAGLPFLTMNALAESLCDFAKAKAKEQGQPRDGNGLARPWPSLIAFHVQSQTAEEDYAEDILPHLASPDGQHRLTANPYAIGAAGAEATGCKQWDALARLALQIDALPGGYGAVRTIQGELAAGRSDRATHLWRRIFSRTDRNEADDARLQPLKDAIATLCGTIDIDTLPVDCGPLFDALELIDLSASDYLCTEPEPAKEGAA